MVVMTKHVTEYADPPKKRFPSISDGFNNLIMKMMQKGNKRLMLVLSQPILDCLDRAREAGDRLYPLNAKTWCFPNSGRRVGHCTGNEDDIAMPLRSEGGLNTTIGAHALRRTYSSNCGLPEEIVDRLLGHTRRANPVMGAYNIDSARIEEYRHLQERASARLVAALGPLGVAGLG